MAERSAIEWTDSTFNPWRGCTKLGPGCDHCYAEAMLDTRLHQVQWGSDKPRQRTSDANWAQPRRWNARPFYQCGDCGWRGETESNCPACAGEVHTVRRRVFCASLADVFDNEVPAHWRADLFALIHATPNLDWLLLTKRIGNAAAMLNDAASAVMDDFCGAPAWERAPWPNVWLGATICNQAEAERDIPKLLRVPAAVRFLSVEPMLGPIDFYKASAAWPHANHPWRNTPILHGIHWIIAGGESGPHARPMHPDWARSLRDQCAAAGVPFLFKQHGEWIGVPDLRNLPEGGGPGFGAYDHCPHDMDAEAVRVGKKAAGRLLDGVTHDAFPEVRHG